MRWWWRASAPEMKVVPHRPGVRVLGWSMLVVALVAAAGLGYVRAYFGTREALLAARTEVDALRGELRRVRDERAELSQLLAEARIGGAIATGSDDRLREVLADQRSRISELEEEIRLYRDLLGEDDGATGGGVRIARLDLLQRLEGRGVRYRLLLVQEARGSEPVRGRVRVRVVGERSGEPVALPLDALAPLAEYPIPVRFRYFQDVAGELELPSGFRPRGVEVTARAEDPEGWRLERTFPWQIQES